MMFVALLLVLVQVSYVTAEASYTQYTCYEYKAFCKDWSSNWDAVKLRCEDLGGWLANIDSESTLQAIKQSINDAGMNRGLCHGWGFWIGLHDPMPTGTGHTTDSFKWVHDMCSSYQKWEPDQPDDQTKKDPLGQSCVQLWFRQNGDMDDEYCFKNKGYICQIPRTCTCTLTVS